MFAVFDQAGMAVAIGQFPPVLMPEFIVEESQEKSTVEGNECSEHRTHKAEDLTFDDPEFSVDEETTVESDEDICRQLCDRLSGLGLDKQSKALQFCKRGAIGLRSENDRKYAAPMSCDKAFCPDCGRKNSHYHNERFVAIDKKLKPCDILAQVVITIPKHLRSYFQDKKSLNKLITVGYDAMKKVFGTSGGCCTLHYFGDREDDYNPHFNFLFPVEEGYRIPEELNELCGEVRKIIARALTKITGEEIEDYEKLNVNYKYKEDDRSKAHAISYVSRPMILPDKLLKQEDDLIKFLVSQRGHTVRWFGKFSNSQVKEHLKSEYNYEVPERKPAACPIDGSELKFNGIFKPKMWATALASRQYLKLPEINLLACVDTFVDYHLIIGKEPRTHMVELLRDEGIDDRTIEWQTERIDVFFAGGFKE